MKSKSKKPPQSMKNKSKKLPQSMKNKKLPQAVENQITTTAKLADYGQCVGYVCEEGTTLLELVRSYGANNVETMQGLQRAPKEDFDCRRRDGRVVLFRSSAATASGAGTGTSRACGGDALTCGTT